MTYSLPRGRWLWNKLQSNLNYILEPSTPPPPPLVADASLWIIYHDGSSNDFKYLSSYVSLAQLQVPFINNMVLGRTFDYSKSMVGNDIYSADAQEKISTQNVGKYEHKFEVIGHLKAQSDLGRVEER